MVHFIVFDDVNVMRPLCGDWAGSTNWTKIVSAVTCPRCLELLQHPAPVGAPGRPAP